MLLKPSVLLYALPSHSSMDPTCGTVTAGSTESGNPRCLPAIMTAMTTSLEKMDSCADSAVAVPG
jgi:hypothetical protein